MLGYGQDKHCGRGTPGPPSLGSRGVPRLFACCCLTGWGREGFKGAHPKATSAACV